MATNTIFTEAQIGFLSEFLSDAHGNDIVNRPENYPVDATATPPKEIADRLNGCDTQLELYEVLEDYGFINDMWYSLVLDSLLAPIVTPQDLGGKLFNIHEHDKSGSIIYYEENLISTLREIGLPEPIWGKTE